VQFARAIVAEDAQTIIKALGGVAMIEPEPKSLEQALEGINAILDVADRKRRKLTTLERDTIIDAALSLLLLSQSIRSDAE